MFVAPRLLPQPVGDRPRVGFELEIGPLCFKLEEAGEIFVAQPVADQVDPITLPLRNSR
jgi:hypothetical protein